MSAKLDIRQDFKGEWYVHCDAWLGSFGPFAAPGPINQLLLRLGFKLDIVHNDVVNSTAMEDPEDDVPETSDIFARRVRTEGEARARLAEELARLAHYKTHVGMVTGQDDYHGIQDTGSDLRDIAQRIEMIYWAFPGLRDEL